MCLLDHRPPLAPASQPRRIPSRPVGVSVDPSVWARSRLTENGVGGLPNNRRGTTVQRSQTATEGGLALHLYSVPPSAPSSPPSSALWRWASSGTFSPFALPTDPRLSEPAAGEGVGDGACSSSKTSEMDRSVFERKSTISRGNVSVCVRGLVAVDDDDVLSADDEAEASEGMWNEGTSQSQPSDDVLCKPRKTTSGCNQRRGRCWRLGGPADVPGRGGRS
jgi:hypothetical protein